MDLPAPTIQTASTAVDTVELICRRAWENPRWGYLRIVDKLQKLGVTVSKTSVPLVLRRHGLSPTPRREGPIVVETIKTPIRSSSERVRRAHRQDSIRVECLDHLLVFSRRHLQAIVVEYLRHYNEARPHRGLRLASPLPQPTIPTTGDVKRHDVLGGTIHEYDIAA